MCSRARRALRCALNKSPFHFISVRHDPSGYAERILVLVHKCEGPAQSYEAKRLCTGKSVSAPFFSCSPHPLLEKRPPPGGCQQVRTHTRARAQWYLLIAARYVLPDALKRKKRISHAVVRGIEARTSARCRPSAATRPRAPGRCCTRTRTRPACSRSSLQCL